MTLQYTVSQGMFITVTFECINRFEYFFWNWNTKGGISYVYKVHAFHLTWKVS